jgi:hypothetical protein
VLHEVNKWSDDSRHVIGVNFKDEFIVYLQEKAHLI